MSINTSLNPSISRIDNVNIFLKELCLKKSIAIALISLGLVSAIFGAISITSFGAAYAKRLSLN